MIKILFFSTNEFVKSKKYTEENKSVMPDLTFWKYASYSNPVKNCISFGIAKCDKVRFPLGKTRGRSKMCQYQNFQDAILRRRYMENVAITLRQSCHKCLKNNYSLSTLQSNATSYRRPFSTWSYWLKFNVVMQLL